MGSDYILIALLILIGIAVYGLPIYLLARAVRLPRPWIAFVPIVGLWPIVALSRDEIEYSHAPSLIYLIAFLVPLVNLVAALVLWAKIVENYGLSNLLAVIVLIPLFGPLVLPWLVLVFGDAERLRPRSR